MGSNFVLQPVVPGNDLENFLRSFPARTLLFPEGTLAPFYIELQQLVLIVHSHSHSHSHCLSPVRLFQG